MAVPHIQFSIRDMLAVMLWSAIGFGATLGFYTIQLPISPAFDLLARALGLFFPMAAGAAFGSAIGFVIRHQFICAVVGVITFSMMLIWLQA